MIQPDRGVMIILKKILKNQDRQDRLDSSGSGQGKVAS